MSERRRPARARRWTLWSLAGVLLLGLAAGSVVLWQHAYDLSEEQVSLRHDGRLLDGVLALPPDGDGPFGLVVFVHGDGPVDATHESHYRPLWESFAAAEPGLRFMIAVSPAVIWQRQGRYNLLAELGAEGAEPERVAEAPRDRETVLELLDRGASFEDYRAAMGDGRDMTAERWGFIQRNHTADATDDLRAAHDVPVLLMLAGHDLNVDVAETGAAYRELLPDLLVLRYPEAGHAMVDAAVERSTVQLTLTGVFAPRRLYTAGFLGDQADYLRGMA
ncbi:hypothetical protein [Phytomonospora endophytica]|uniref:Alpha/beta hydrolase n=1 Tax=Phytomonospora endophytica TaxID=714109 RepID=A0A841FFK1_9ACTN|nr:hypothetical protein [Phytomonospora endophytica]MBB6035046.1 hypothetical protein [Phytomonospora endophytica]